MIGTVAGVGGLALELSHVRRAQPDCPASLPSGFAPCIEASLDKFRVDEIYGLAGRPADPRTGGRMRVSRHVSGGSAGDGVARLPRLFGRDVLARYQNGLIQYYAAVSALSVAILLLILVLLTQLFTPGQLTRSDFRPRGLTDGDTAGDHGPAPALGSLVLVLDAQDSRHTRPG